MSLLPLISDMSDLWRPSRLWDQQVYLGLDDEDLLSPWVQRKLRRSLSSSPYNRLTRRKDSDSLVSVDKNKFQVNVDVQQFSPEEISVKATGEDTITIEAKHEEKQDEHGYISRHFVRRYKIPKGHDLKKSVSKLSSDGVLTVSVPKATPKSNEIDIPITFTNQPSKIEQKPQEQAENGDGCDGDASKYKKNTPKKK